MVINELPWKFDNINVVKLCAPAGPPEKNSGYEPGFTIAVFRSVEEEVKLFTFVVLLV